MSFEYGLDADLFGVISEGLFSRDNFFLERLSAVHTFLTSDAIVIIKLVITI